MNLLSVEAFAADRAVDQEGLEDALRPTVQRWLTDEDTHWDDLRDVIEAAYAEVYEAAGGTKRPTSGMFLRQVKTALGKGGEPDEHTVDRITVWLATGILNSATISAAKHDPDEINLQWVTMHDDKVREAHRDVDGQVRAPSDFYMVDGHKMRYPGDPSAPIELWINCRCTLAPVKADSVAAGGEVVEFVSEKPWSGSASRFTPEQWKKSCVMHVCDGMEKSCHKLPIREPGGELSRAGVHAAASRINQTDGPAEAKASAKRALRGAYRQLGEDPPDNLAAALEGDDMDPEDQTEEQVEETPEEESAVADAVPWYGVLAPEGVRSGDGRKFAEGALSGRPLPLPLKYQKTGAAGHDGDVVVGRIDRMWRQDGLIRADGTFLNTPEADEFIGMIADFGKFGVSVDADDAEMEFNDEGDEITFSKARIAGATGVAIPAFHEAFVAIGEWGESDLPGDDADFLGETIADDDEEALVASVGADLASLFKRGPGWITDPVATKRIHDYWTKPGEEGYAKIAWGTGGDFNRCRVLVGEKIAANSPEDMRFINNICAQWHHDALGIWPGEHKVAAETEEFADAAPGPAMTLVASAGFCAPSEWFADPELDSPTAITITEEGRVFGHLARWDTCHMQFTGVCITAPHSATDYAYFLTGEMLTDAGAVPVGRITLGGGHAPGTLRWRPAAEHYDSTSAVVSYVTCGEDEHGIWLAGMVKPGTSEKDIMSFRAAPLSGDWRKVGHNLELIAALAVNSGGFPVPRVSVYGGEQISLVAAGFLPPVEEPTGVDVERFADAVLSAMQRRRDNKAKIAALAGRAERKKKMAALAARVQGE